MTRRALPALLTAALLASAPACSSAQPADRPDGRQILVEPPSALLHIRQDPDGRGDYRAFRNTQALLAKTRLVATAALRKPGIAELGVVKQQKDPVGWLLDNLETDFPLDGEVLRVRIEPRGRDAGELARLVNAVAECYLDEFVNKGPDDRAARLKHLRGLEAKSNERLAEARRQLKTAGADAQGQALQERSVIEALFAAEKELRQVQSDLRRLQAELTTVKDEASGIPDAVLDEAVGRDPRVQELQGEVARQEDKISYLTKAAKDGAEAAVVLSVKQRLQEVRKELATVRENRREAIARQFREKNRAEGQTAGDKLKQQVKTLEALEKELSAEVQRLRAQAAQARTRAAEAEALRGDIAHLEEMAKRIAAEVAALEAEGGRSAPRITLLERAEAAKVK